MMRSSGTVLLLPILAAVGLGATTRPGPTGLDLSARELSVKPGDDFYGYENGRWIAQARIPADDVSISMGSENQDRVDARVRELIVDASHGVPLQPTTTDGKIGAMYLAYMDEARVDALGATPIAEKVGAAAAANDRTAIATLMGRTPYDFERSIFGFRFGPDLKHPEQYATYLSTNAGLGMPGRDYYLDPGFADKREAYVIYVTALLKQVGWPEPLKAAKDIMAMETQIARVTWTTAESRDLRKRYHPMSPAELTAFAPGFPWAAFLRSAGLADKREVVVSQWDSFPKIAAIYAATPLSTLKAAVAFGIADNAAQYLSMPFRKASFEYSDHALWGQSEMTPRWKRAIATVSGSDCGFKPSGCFGTLNWAVGELYVRHDFPPAIKAKADALVANVTAAFRARITKVDWMAPATKREALSKLDTYNVKIGYPEHPRDYSNVVIRSDDLVGDVLRATEADWAFQVKRSAGPVDRTDWSMTPQTFDAYNGNLRDVVFPAAFLQPPNFDPRADDATNYGTIGTMIGHELTHGFDDQGRQIDSTGVLRDWWTPADATAFAARAARLGAQFRLFEPLPGMHINPDLTMGENIADLGGLAIALDAYHRSLHGKRAPIINGLSGDQRFFMAYAQQFRGKDRDDSVRMQIASNPHSARRFRVNGPVSNTDAWYAAFGVRPADRLYRIPADRVRIW